MEKSGEILNELRTISPLLAHMEKVNMFSVPDGYFIDLNEKIATTVFLQADKKNNFQNVPEGYFDALSSNILSRIKEEETTATDKTDLDYPTLDALKQKNVFIVPDGYFASLSSKILSRIKDEEQSVESEIKSISPSLHYLKGEEVFSVPDGYFHDLSDRILNKVKGQQNAKVISLDSVKKWWRYAAAAVVAGIITFTSLQLFKSQDSSNGINIAASSANLPAYVRLASQYKTPKQLDQGIASLTDDEIAKYLEKNTSILDDETLVKNTDTKELPTPDDYLFDDNALENYLQKINVESTNKNMQ